MKKRKKVIIGILSCFVLLYINNSFFTERMVEGKYVNRNYENSFIGENPHVADTLIIKSDNRFESKFYGKGNYKLSYNLGGTQIRLIYKDEFGQTSFGTSIDRLFFLGNLRIILFKDLDQYYEKID